MKPLSSHDDDEFERRLRRQPLRQIPQDWRAEILSAAAAAKSSPPLKTILAGNSWRRRLSTLNDQLSAVFWPSPTAWAGLAAVWIALLAFNRVTVDRNQGLGALAVNPDEVTSARREEEKMLVELIGPVNTPVADRPKIAMPAKRSESLNEGLRA